MRIPKNIKIGGINYKVEEVDSESHELVSGTTVGHIYYDKQLIAISESVGDDRKGQILAHEMLHAILLAMGHNTDDEIVLNEKFIDALASYLHQVLDQIGK